MKFLDSTGLGVLWNKIKANFYTKTETDTKLGTKQNVSDKVTSVTKESTDTEYPSAKAVYDAIEDYCAHDYSKDYLTFETLENGTFSFSENALQYSLDDGTTWATLPANTATPTVTSGGTIMWKQDQSELSIDHNGMGSFSSTGDFNVYGNIMSLLYLDDFFGKNGMPDSVFSYLFGSAVNLISAENLILPSTTLTDDCYQNMFNGCTSLTSAPEILPAIILAVDCYYGMFANCTSLARATELPATTLAVGCYYSMFYKCTSLTTAPVLPATTLADACYSGMFANCTSLNYIKCLATNISATNCTNNWVQNVASSGTFICDSRTPWSNGNHGVPSNWTRMFDIVGNYVNNVYFSGNDLYCKINPSGTYQIRNFSPIAFNANYELLYNKPKVPTTMNLSNSTSRNTITKFKNKPIQQLLIPIDPSKNNYSGDSLSDIMIIPYLSNNEKYLALELGNKIKEWYVIIESNLIGSGFYSNASILYNNGVVQIYPTLPLNLIKDNLQYLMLSYYIDTSGEISDNLFLWFDDYAAGDYTISALNDWVENESETDANNWYDYVQSYLLSDYPRYRGANCYKYTNEMFEWEGELYYLWEGLDTPSLFEGTDSNSPISYMLTNTINYNELYNHSLESDYRNHWCPYVVKFNVDDETVGYSTVDENDILIMVTNNQPVKQDIWIMYIGLNQEYYDDWDDYCEGFLLDVGTNYGQSNEYVYVGETFEWDGNEYYLWYENTFDFFILTDTIDYQDLYDMSIEANHYNMNCPYVAMLNVDQEFWYDGNERQNDWLIKVVEDNNNPGQAISLYIDDFVI